MKYIRTLLMLSMLFLVLSLFFYFFHSPPAGETQSADQRAVISVLDGGEVISMPLSEYLSGVVAAEMPAEFEPEALKAQAVAARTYVLAVKRHDQARVCTDSSCCMAYMQADEMKELWGDDYEKNIAKIRAAVEATDGQYLSYQGAPIQAVFHASSNGSTENSGALWSALPYLISVETPESAETDARLLSTVSLSPEDLAAALDLHTLQPPEEWLEAVRRDDAGRVKGVLLCGQAYTGQYLRQSLGLKSTDFTLEWTGDLFLFTVAGNGHGIGMSQYGANLFAQQGWDYADILAHYYPETALAG